MEPVTPEDVRSAEFGYERDGYDVDTVDELLTQVAFRLTRGRDAAALLPGALPTRPRGYRRPEVDALLDRVRAVTPTGPEPGAGLRSLLSDTTLVIGRPAIHGADGTQLGRAEFYGNGAVMIYDGARPVASARSHRFSRGFVLSDPDGRALGRVVARRGVFDRELRRATLYVDDTVAGKCRVEPPAPERRTSERSMRRHAVRDPANAELARITAVAGRGASVRLEIGQPVDPAMRILLVYLAAVPAFPPSPERGMPPPQMPV